MKISSFLYRLKRIKKYLRGTRSVVALAIVGVLLIGTVSVAAYTIRRQDEKQPVAEKVQNAPTKPAPKVEQEPAVVAEEKAVVATDSTQSIPIPVQTNKPAATQARKPRAHTSEDPAYVACVQKYSDLYVKYNADIESINAEKNLALATLDELYNTGFYEEMYPEDTDQYNFWQMDRAELVVEYDTQLAEINRVYATNSAVYLNC